MSLEENKALIRRFTEEGWNGGNLAIFDELLPPSYVAHDPMATVQGPEGFKQFYVGCRTAFPDTHVAIEDVIAEGEKVVERWTGTGTHQGPFQGIPQTGKYVTITGMSISRIAGGKIEEAWFSYDALGMLQQLGVVLSMG